jgi:hypothetical protein
MIMLLINTLAIKCSVEGDLMVRELGMVTKGKEEQVGEILFGK